MNQFSMYTVYETKSAVELHSGCRDHPTCYVICTSRLYEVAYETAQLRAKQRGLPLINLVDCNNSVDP